MWLMDDSPALLTDLYELTMGQVYFKKRMEGTAYFEVFVRHLPEHWGFLVMAGLAEVESYLREFRFCESDIGYLRSTGIFEDDFLEYLSAFRPKVTIRALPEGTVFFPHEPVMEVSGPILHAQLLESYILNILGFSIIEASLATRMVLAADGVPVVDFGLRRCQGPVASVRAARGAQIAGFTATSNVLAAMRLGMPASGTAAHSFIEAHESETQAFHHFIELYRDTAILPVDTYQSVAGMEIAARVAQYYQDRGIRIRGIRLDSGDLVELSRFARDLFKKKGVEFLRIFASGDLDEFRIADALEAGAEIDGFGVGTRFAASQRAPAIGIVYKIARYANRDLHKSSPEKGTVPGRKTILRTGDVTYEKDTVVPFGPGQDDLCRPFESVEQMPTIQKRLERELSGLPDAVRRIRDPAGYPVEFVGFAT